MDDRADSVKLVIGDGSGATARFIAKEILSRLGNEVLNQLEDGGQILVPKNHLVFTTDSYIIDPPFFPNANIGKLAVTGTINDLVASGATPLYLTLGLIVAEGYPLESLRKILDSVAQAVTASNVMIVCGDTKVIDKESFSGVILNTAGLGVLVDVQRTYALANAQVGDKIVITGTIGDHGLALLSFREGLGFEQRVHSDCAALDDLLLPLLTRYCTIHSMRDPTRGGVLNVLFDVAEASLAHIILDVSSLPIKHEVQMGCEMLGLDPLLLPNEGRMVMIVSSSEVDRLMKDLRKHNLGLDSAIIGEIAESPDRKGRVLLREKDTLKIRVRPEGDALPRLC